ncbi:MAG TPA: gamma carbonic anhydrase family protein [Candidatus Megamonas gallistercoris]|nr:gamma carbonic anhydrase family protein [Candidatus Megamonas gallistercoris]
MIYTYKSHTPKIAKTALIHPSAVVIGDVTIGEHSTIWPGAVLRGDLQPIYVGDYTNIQDNVTVHVMSDAPIHIGSYVTIGHNAVIHGSKVGDNTLIGMGAILLGYSEIGHNSVIGAGTLITEHKKLPNNSMIYGSPAKVIRALREDEIEALRKSAEHYNLLAQNYKNEE